MKLAEDFKSGYRLEVRAVQVIDDAGNARTIQLRVAEVDLEKCLASPIWSNSWLRASAYQERNRRLLDETHPHYRKNSSSPFNFLKQVSNGTFQASVIVGHLVGYRSDNTGFELNQPSTTPVNRNEYWWNVLPGSPVDPGKRWFVGVENRANIATSLTTKANLGSTLSAATFSTDFFTLIHGGFLLHDTSLDSLVPFSAYKADYLSRNTDRVNGTNAYDGINGSSANPTKHRWGIGLDGGAKILIVSTDGPSTGPPSRLDLATIHEFAQAMQKQGMPTNVMFDGGSHHGYHAVKENGYTYLYQSQVNTAQHNLTQSHFGTYVPMPVGLTKISGQPVVPDRKVEDSIISVLHRPGSDISLSLYVDQADYLKPIKDVEILLANKAHFDAAHDVSNLPPNLYFQKLFPFASLNLRTENNIILSARERAIVETASALNPSSAVVAVSARDHNDRRFSSKYHNFKLDTGQRYLLLLDVTGNVPIAAAKARNKATEILGSIVLEKAQMIDPANPYSGYPTDTALFMTDSVPIELLCWTNDRDEFLNAATGVPVQGGIPDFDLNSALRAMRDRFGHECDNSPAPDPNKRLRLILYAASKHSVSPQVDWRLVSGFFFSQIRIHTIGTGSTNQNDMKRIADETGGSYTRADTRRAIEDAFLDAWLTDQDDQAVFKSVFPGSGAIQTDVRLNTTGLVSILFRWDPPDDPTNQLFLQQPDGTRVKGADVSGYDYVRFIASTGYALFTILNPGQVNTPNDKWSVGVESASPSPSRRGAIEVWTMVAAREAVVAPEPPGEPPIIEIETVGIPDQVAVNATVPVIVEFSQVSVTPAAVTVLSRRENEMEFLAFPLERNDNGPWEGQIAGLTHSEGSVDSYVEASLDAWSVRYPANAPQELLSTAIGPGSVPAIIRLVDAAVPEQIIAGQDLTATIGVAENSLHADELEWIERTGAFAVSLEKISASLWQGAVDGSALTPGIYHSYFVARAPGAIGYAPENAPQGAYPTQVTAVPPIEFDPSMSSVASNWQENEAMPVRAQIKEGSPVPDTVTLNVRHIVTGVSRDISLSGGSSGVWQGSVPAAIMVPGLLQSYFEAKSDLSRGVLPIAAPDETLETKITAQPVSGASLWMVEYVGPYDGSSINVELTRRDAITGAKLASAGVWPIWGNYSNDKVLRIAVPPHHDHGDGGVWLYAAKDPRRPVRPILLKFDVSGKVSYRRDLHGGMKSLCADSNKGVLYVSCDACYYGEPALLSIDLNTNRELILAKRGQWHLFLPTPEGFLYSGSLPIAGDGGIHRYDHGVGFRRLTTWYDRVNFMCADREGGVFGVGRRNHHSDLNPYLFHVDYRGAPVASLKNPPVLWELIYDNDKKRLFALTRDIGSNTVKVVCYDASLQERFRIDPGAVDVERFDSLFVEVSSGRVLVTGTTPDNKAFCGHIDESEQLEKISELRGPAIFGR